MEIKEDLFTIDIAHFILKRNQDRKEISYYLPDNYKEIEELISDGAKVISCYQDNDLIGVAIIDICDNNSIEINGPFGSLEVRKELLNYIKNNYSEYRLYLFTSDKNELLSLCEINSDELSMEILCKDNYNDDNIANYNNEPFVKELHNELFPRSYYNGDTVACELNILIYKDLGYIAYEEGYIHFLGVRNDSRNKGIGTSLVKQVLSQNYGDVVRLTVASSNIEAVNLYKKLGFRTICHMVSAIIKK